MMRMWKVPARAGLIAAAVLAAAMATPALAGQIRPAQGAYSSGTGGEFKITQFSGMPVQPAGPFVNEAGSLFQTFCLETDETFTPGNLYNWDLNTKAVAGGANTNSGDPLDPLTAYLYTQFYNGVLSTYDFDNSSNLRQSHAGELQEAIWYIEQEIGSINGQALTWYNEAVAAGWTTIRNVRVLNLYTNTVRVEHQDMLVIVPTPQAAAAGLSLLAGLVVTGLVRRRRLQDGDSA